MDNWMVGSRGNNTREGKFMLVPKVYVGTKSLCWYQKFMLVPKNQLKRKERNCALFVPTNIRLNQ